MPRDRITRREMLKYCAALGTGLAILGPRAVGATFEPSEIPADPRAAATPVAWFPVVPANVVPRYQPIPLSGSTLEKFVEPVPVFGPASGGLKPRVAGFNIIVAVHEFRQKILPAAFYAALPDPGSQEGTWVWGYSVGGQGPSYPAYTIESRQNVPTNITFLNSLPQPPALQPYLTVDQTIHWADPLHQMGSRAPYEGPPPIVVHLHGGEVASVWDGHPDAWFTPEGPGRLTGGAWFSNVFDYPNAQDATTLWFHDHTLGVTRLNIYAGLSGF
jgi:spore coat protein A, manganese oxidase